MKRIFSLFLAAILVCLSGCTALTGGINRRNMGMYMPVWTDGEQEFLEVCVADLYFSPTADGFRLSDKACPDPYLTEKARDTQWVISFSRTGFAKEIDLVGLDPQYSFLEESFAELLEQQEYMECMLFCKDGEFYGILNCYRRSAGRSGTGLAFEDLKFSCLLTVEDQKLVLGAPMKEVALLACSPTHYIAYRDKRICSVSKETGKQTVLVEDIWWNQKENINDISTFCTDEIFYFYGWLGGSQQQASFYACYMDGSGLQQLPVHHR